MRHINRRLYKTKVIDKPTPNTLLEKLKQDYLNAVKGSNSKLVYKKSAKSQYKMKRRKSTKEYVNYIEAREKAQYEAEFQAALQELEDI